MTQGQPAGRPRAGVSGSQAAAARYAGLLLGATAATGVATYAYLVLARRGMTVGQWSDFSVWWSLALVVGFGFFLPVEQEAARLLRPGDPRSALRPLAVTAGVAGATALTALAAGSSVLLPALGGQTWLFVLLLAMAALSAVQFLTRGVLLGTADRRAYPGVLLGDAALRCGLAAALLLAGTEGSVPFAACLAVAVLLAHGAPLLALLTHWPRAGRTVPEAARGHAVRGWISLLPGSLAAQVLQNGAPFAVALAASARDSDAPGRFLAAFTLARVPLFLGVPVQSALVPPLARLVEQGRADRVRALVTRMAAATAAAGVAGGLLALLVGRPVLGLLFGTDLLVPAGDLALMVVGVCVHLGLIVLTQALVAMDRQGAASTSWVVAVATAAAVFLVVQPLLLRAELAFLLGSLLGAAVAASALVVAAPARSSRRVGDDR
jgi:O-antigen/teichoic acid export membrane protein